MRLVTHGSNGYSILPRCCRQTGKRRASHIDGHCPVAGRSLARVLRDAHRRPSALGRFLYHQRQPALHPYIDRRQPGGTPARGLRLRRQLRRLPDNRRPAGRPLWPPPTVPHRHGRLHRHQHAVRPRRHAGPARIGPYPPGPLRRHAGASGAWLDPRIVPERGGTRQGAQPLRRDDGTCRLHRPVLRRRAGRMESVRPGLAHRVPCQAADRPPRYCSPPGLWCRKPAPVVAASSTLAVRC